ncbi:MAG TPA: hypothetical protein VGB30_08525 [bacterium]
MKTAFYKLSLLTITLLVSIIMAGPASAETDLLLLVDASSSMSAYGTPGSGNSKFATVRGGLTTFLQELPEGINVGLRIVGGSPSADCYSSFMRIPVGAGNRSRIQDSLMQIAPGGDRGLMQGIDDGISDLITNDPSRRGVLLVITDDGDDCGRDAEYITDVYKYTPGRPDILILGLDLSQDAGDVLGEIIAELGGRLLNLTSLESIQPTMATLAGQFNNNLTIYLHDSSGNEVAGDITIKNVDTGLVVFEGLDQPSYVVNLDPGEYQVSGRYLGEENKSEIITVGEDQFSSVSLSFSIYRDPLSLSLRDIYGNALRARVTFLNSSMEAVYTTEIGSFHQVELPAGTYTLEIRVGDRVEKVYGITVGPGYDDYREVELPIEIGTLEVEVYNQGGIAINGAITIYDQDGTIVDEAPNSSYLYSRLPEGTYRVRVELDDQVVEDDAYLYGGDEELVSLELDLPLGDLYITLSTDSGDEVWGWVRIYDSDGNLFERVDRYGSNPSESPEWYISDLPVGTYRVEAQAEGIVRTATGVQILENQEVEVDITFPDSIYFGGDDDEF